MRCLSPRCTTKVFVGQKCAGRPLPCAWTKSARQRLCRADSSLCRVSANPVVCRRSRSHCARYCPTRQTFFYSSDFSNNNLSDLVEGGSSPLIKDRRRACWRAWREPGAVPVEPDGASAAAVTSTGVGARRGRVGGGVCTLVWRRQRRWRWCGGGCCGRGGTQSTTAR
jgi:hypothetical protein